jgi:hypothetical protein
MTHKSLDDVDMSVVGSMLRSFLEYHDCTEFVDDANFDDKLERYVDEINTCNTIKTIRDRFEETYEQGENRYIDFMEVD